MKQSKLLKELKYRGLFSEYLPANFNLTNDKIDIYKKDIAKNGDSVEPMKFNMSRFTDNFQRRYIYLPEPTAYINLIKFLESNNLLDKLVEFAMNSESSFSKILQEDGSVLRHEIMYSDLLSLKEVSSKERSSFIGNLAEKIIRGKGAKGVLYLDIANFYSNIYTHIFPTILLGYNQAFEQYKLDKSNSKDARIKGDYKLLKELDGKVRELNGNRTNGILTGPLVSFILAETLLSRIDLDLENQGLKFVRYMDDYEIFVFNENEVDILKSKFIKVLSQYHLNVNEEKTKYYKYPYFKYKDLEKVYSEFAQGKAEASDLIEMFNRFFELEDAGSKGAVRYLVKSLDSKFNPKNWELFQALLLNVLSNDNRSLIKVCEILIEKKENIVIDENFKELIQKLIVQYSLLHKDLEVIWLIYLLKSLGIRELDIEVIKTVIDSLNELAIVIVLEEFDELLTEDILLKVKENSSSWILAYQLYHRDYIDENAFKAKVGLRHNLDFYKQLKYKKFSFYKKIDTSKSASKKSSS